MDVLPKNDPRLERILITSDEISDRVTSLACEIRAVYGEENDLCIVGILKGASVFMTDLARALCRAGMPGITMVFVRASTYGDTIKETGETVRKVKLDLLGANIRSKNILIVDDILDQGFTLSAIEEKMKQEYPEANIKTCVFLKKNLAHPSDEAKALRRKYKADFTGFEVEDRWVVGYGLDAGECYRELPYIAIANEECFRHG